MFVCTGNMFRSASAEYALRNYLMMNKEKIYDLCGFSPSEIFVSSCATSVRPYPLHKSVVDEFKKKDINIFNHMYIQIDKRLIDENDLIVSMSKDHNEYLKTNFQIDSPLFNKICYDKDEGILDDWEVFDKKSQNDKKRDKHISSTVNYICDSIPFFVKNFAKFLR